MGLRSRVRGVVDVFAGGWLLGLVACQSPGSERIVGPDGSPMAHVHCGSEQGACFRLAGELCPTGYEIRPVLSRSEGNFLVRCRAAGTPAVGSPPARVVAARVAPAALTAAARATSPPGDTWPPTAEPSPAAYPWPGGETSATAGTPGAANAQADVDIGY